MASSFGASVGGNGNDRPSTPDIAVLDVIRRKLGKVQANLESNYESVIQRILPGKRGTNSTTATATAKGPASRPSSLYDVDGAWQPFPEQIEMSSMKQKGQGRGHQFDPCHLSNPTWCDKCGDFIWGLYKQCQRCQHCQYTCHLHCVPSVTLDCVTVSPGSGGEGPAVPVATPTDLPSPSHTLHSPISAETSLTERKTIVNHGNIRSPQKQRSSETAETAANSDSIPDFQASPSSRTVSQSVQHLTPALSASSRCSSSPSVSTSLSSSHHQPSSSSSSSIRDPLSGEFVTLPTSLSSSGAWLSRERGALSSSSSVLSSSSSPSSCVEKDLNQNAKSVDSTAGSLAVPGTELRLAGEEACDVTTEKDETDSGYRSGTIPDDKLPKAPSQATLNRMELRRKIHTFNHWVPTAALVQKEDDESFQGFLRVTLNLIRPITMELGARPPSIYELLTREHIVEQSTQHVAFYMPRDTVKSIHISSKTTTKEVVSGLLKKFHILDHPRKFAMYEQEFSDKNKLVKLRRLNDKDCPLVAMLSWEPERVKHYRLVLQENETGEIVWENFSEPELKNFQIVLDREEKESIAQLQYKYRVMKRIILQRMKELRHEKRESKA